MFKIIPGEHKVVILGEMLELGTENAAAHEEIVRCSIRRIIFDNQNIESGF